MESRWETGGWCRSRGVRARVGEASGRPTKVGHPVARVGSGGTRERRRTFAASSTSRMSAVPSIRGSILAIRARSDPSSTPRSRARAPSGPSGAAGVPVFRMARFARFSGLSRQLAVVFVEKYASEVARQQPSAAPRASWRLLLAVRGRRGLPNPRRDPRLSLATRPEFPVARTSRALADPRPSDGGCRETRGVGVREG